MLSMDTKRFFTNKQETTKEEDLEQSFVWPQICKLLKVDQKCLENF